VVWENNEVYTWGPLVWCATRDWSRAELRTPPTFWPGDRFPTVRLQGPFLSTKNQRLRREKYNDRVEIWTYRTDIAFILEFSHLTLCIIICLCMFTRTAGLVFTFHHVHTVFASKVEIWWNNYFYFKWS
jgi:hypothetical protein